MKEFQIDGFISIPDGLDQENFKDAFIELIESKGWNFGGAVFEVIDEEVPICDHPLSMQTTYHDNSIVCQKCRCIISQFDEPIFPPTPL